MSNPYQYQPEEVLIPEFLAEYEQIRGDLFESLVFLHTNLQLIEQILDFRWQFYQGPSALFTFFAQNLYEYSVVITHRVWNDQSNDAVTIKRFRNLVEKNIKDEFRHAFHIHLRELRPTRKKTQPRFRANKSTEACSLCSSPRVFPF